MHPCKRYLLLVGGMAAFGCGRSEAPASSSRPERVASTPFSNLAQAASCPVGVGRQRLDADTVLGLPAWVPVRELSARCPKVRLDTVGVGGTTAVALRFDAPGITVWAVQSAHDPYDDSLHENEPADLWALRGDSLHFSDGQRVPMQVGALRALDSVGVVVIDHGDDGTGSYITRCRYPSLAFVVGNTWPRASSGSVPLRSIAATDTTSIWRIEITRKPEPVVRHACVQNPVT